MSEPLTQLKICKLSKEIRVIDLINALKNKEENGDGPIQEIMIHYSSEECYAIITFEEKDAVSRIMNRGTKICVLDFYADIEIFIDTKSSWRESNALKDQPDHLNSRCTENKNPGTNLETSFISPSEKMPENVPIYEDTGNEIWNRTIKAHICDRKKSKKYYEIYFDDIGLNSYESETMMLDGLHKLLYVTFKDIADAQKLCQLPLDTENCNISKVEMAQKKDFDTYDDRLFLLSYNNLSLKDLVDAVTKKSGSQVKDIIQEDETCAAVIVFDEIDVSSLTWSLTNLNGIRMITAPVYKENSVFITGLNSDIKKADLLRYLRSKKHSGGGQVGSIDLSNEHQASVIFVDERDVESFLGRSHELEDCQLVVSRIHSCLWTNYLRNYVSEEELNALTQPPVQAQKPNELDKPKKKKKGAKMLPSPETEQKSAENLVAKKTKPKTEEIIKKVNLEAREYKLLNYCDYFNEVMTTCQQAGVSLVIENQTIVLKGTMSSVMNIELEILKKCKSDIGSKNLDDLKLEQKQFLKIEKIRERLNELLPGGYLEFLNNEFVLFYLKSVDDPGIIIQLLKTQISTKKKKLSSEDVSALKTSTGQTFLEKYSTLSDTNDLGVFCLFDEVGSYLFIMAPEEEINDIKVSVDSFLLQNKLISETMTYPEGKIMFLQKYLQQEVTQLQNEKDINIKAEKNAIILTGVFDNVLQCTEKLRQWRDIIVEDSLTLKYYGIKECLQDQNVQSLVSGIADKNNCILTQNLETAASLTDKDFDAEAQSASGGSEIKEGNVFHEKINIGKLEVILEEGEITNQKTEAIVTTVDKSMDLTKGRMSKTVLEKAGDKIQQEINSKHSYNMVPGDIISTSGGNLRCFYILFVYILRVKDASNASNNTNLLYTMENIVRNILREADRLNVQTISIPALGTGQLGYSAEITAQATVKAIKSFEMVYSRTKLKSIRLVVFPKDKEVLQVFRSIVLSNRKDPGSSSSYGNKDYKQKDTFKETYFDKVKLVVKQGDITKESECEAIVNSINDNMDLSKSGRVGRALLDTCGRDLQEECFKKKPVMAKDGLVVTRAPKLHCKNIFHMNQDTLTKDLAMGLTNVLKQADQHGMKSLALPALGAGFRHTNVKEIKKIMLEAILKFSQSRPHSLLLIKIVIFDTKILEVFMEHEQKEQSPEGAGKMPRLSEEVLLNIYSDSKQKLESSKKELEQLFENNYIASTIPDIKGLHLLSGKHFDELMKFGLSNQIQVVVNVENKQVQLYGFNKSAIDEVLSRLENLLTTALDTAKTIKKKPKEPQIVWQFQRGESWHPFEPLVNHLLEQDFAKGKKSCDIQTALNETCFIDFVSKKQVFLNSERYPSFSYNIRRITLP